MPSPYPSRQRGRSPINPHSFDPYHDGRRQNTRLARIGRKGTRMTTGTHGAYQWLEVDHDLGEFISLCPSAIVGKYLVITAVDSGSFVPSEQDVAGGWTAASGIAYSPRMESTAILPLNCCCRECGGYDEWYIFERRPPSLGSVCHANVFTSEIRSGNVFQFINFMGLRFSDARMNAISDLFWRQIDWIQPESYLADGEGCLLFATRNSQIFGAIREALIKGPSKHSAPA